jgi:hypothetical protein
LRRKDRVSPFPRISPYFYCCINRKGLEQFISRILYPPRTPSGLAEEDDHSSSSRITSGIQRLTRKPRAGHPPSQSYWTGTVSLFSLAPCGVFPATPITRDAVRSYIKSLRTAPFHPYLPASLPCREAVYFLWHFPYPRGSLALRGTLPCGVRTFLSSRTVHGTVGSSDHLNCSSQIKSLPATDRHMQCPIDSCSWTAETSYHFSRARQLGSLKARSCLRIPSSSS